MDSYSTKTQQLFMRLPALLFVILYLFSSISGYPQKLQPPMVLWYKQRATVGDSLPYKTGKTTNPFDDRNRKGWVEALPIGNGRMGAMIYGGTTHERIQLNEESLWAGYVHDENNPDAAAALPVVRKLLFEGRDDSAVAIANKSMIGMPKTVASYQPMGDVWIEFAGLADQKITNYYRGLNIDKAVTTVSFEQDGVIFTREAFASHPDNIIVVRMTASRKGRLSLKISLDREKDATSTVKNNTLILGGKLNVPDPMGVNQGMSFQISLLPIITGGKLSIGQNSIVITNADEVQLLISQATSYGGKEPGKLCAAALSSASKQPYTVLKRKHIFDYQKLYGRVKMNLNNVSEKEVRSIPTDIRVERAGKDTTGDDYLSELQYQYSRYLMISCSRPGDLPANLQGLWNQHVKPAWESDYHTNINQQMNYWFVEAANLAECHEPLIDYIDTLMSHGKRTAKIHYNANGWVAHHASDLFGYTAPVAGVWGVWPVGGAWLSRHSYEHYLYNRDKKFLQEKVYPQIHDAAQFFLDFLIEVPRGLPFEGRLVTNPSHSPENAFERPDGTQSQFTYGATMDLEIIRDLFDNCLEAIAVLQKDNKDFDKDFQLRLLQTKERLVPIQISASGRIQEWIEDYKEVEIGHRHISQMYGLYPDNYISPVKTPELAQAALKTLEVRLKGNPDQPKTKFGTFDSYLDGKRGTGWGRAWISLLYSRLGLGEEAYKHHKYLQSQFVLPDLLGIAHGTYQIDNVFGNAAAINEMLLQSQEGFIHLLPALPSKWKSGFVRGLRAIGNFEISMEWENGNLINAGVVSKSGELCKLKTARPISKIISGKEPVSFSRDENGVTSFATTKNNRYKFSFK